MHGVGTILIKIFRILIGLLLLIYGLWINACFFFPQALDMGKYLRDISSAAEFFLIDVASVPEFSLLFLFIGTIYFLSAIMIMTLKYKPRIGATYLLFSIWIFILFFSLLIFKQGLPLGFSGPVFMKSIEKVFMVIRISALSILALPFLIGKETEG
ncbi:MAG: hypothetical protein PHU64_03395 [Candidatus Omnitrophica bacterium]|nr:hypothetical protein [Candidatus Omnitrophota bacterium]MDD5430114.1 hypothetical protein [Candidatus Omnitrophota bacterium]